jgi:hypothetical protein
MITKVKGRGIRIVDAYVGYRMRGFVEQVSTGERIVWQVSVQNV